MTNTIKIYIIILLWIMTPTFIVSFTYRQAVGLSKIKAVLYPKKYETLPDVQKFSGDVYQWNCFSKKLAQKKVNAFNAIYPQSFSIFSKVFKFWNPVHSYLVAYRTSHEILKQLDEMVQLKRKNTQIIKLDRDNVLLRAIKGYTKNSSSIQPLVNALTVLGHKHAFDTTPLQNIVGMDNDFTGNRLITPVPCSDETELLALFPPEGLYGSVDFGEGNDNGIVLNETKIVTPKIIDEWIDEIRTKHNLCEKKLFVPYFSRYKRFYVPEFLHERRCDEEVELKNITKNSPANQTMADLKRRATENYKIHVMPKNAAEYKEILQRVFDLLKENEALRESLACFKLLGDVVFDNDPDIMEKYLIAQSRWDDVVPVVVFYPHLGKEHAQRVLDILVDTFKDIQGSGIIPRHNEKVTNLIYFAQGNADDKIGNFLDYFEPFQHIYFDRYFEDKKQPEEKYWLENPTFEYQFNYYRESLELDCDENQQKFITQIKSFNIVKKSACGLSLLDIARTLRTAKARNLVEQYDHVRREQPIDSEPSVYHPENGEPKDDNDFVVLERPSLYNNHLSSLLDRYDSRN